MFQNVLYFIFGLISLIVLFLGQIFQLQLALSINYFPAYDI